MKKWVGGSGLCLYRSDSGSVCLSLSLIPLGSLFLSHSIYLSIPFYFLYPLPFCSHGHPLTTQCRIKELKRRPLGSRGERAGRGG